RKERIDRVAADGVQVIALGRILRQLPGLCLIETLVDPIGDRHDISYDLAEFSTFIRSGKTFPGSNRVGPIPGRLVPEIEHLPVELAGDERGGTAGDVDVLADQVAVHPGEGVLRV